MPRKKAAKKTTKKTTRKKKTPDYSDVEAITQNTVQDLLRQVIATTGVSPNVSLKSQPPELPEVTQEQIMAYMTAFGLADKLTEPERQQFVEIARAFKLNPFKREIYCVPYEGYDGRKLSIITGYEVYIKRAERSGKLAGWNVKTEGTGSDMTATITINRKDWPMPFEHTVYFGECAQTKRDGTLTGFWKRMPSLMLRKVAISQGFRLAFPDELGGMPYTADELPANMSPSKEEMKKVEEATAKEEETMTNDPAVEEIKKEEDAENFLDELRDTYKEGKRSRLFNPDELAEMQQDISRAGKDPTLLAELSQHWHDKLVEKRGDVF